MENTGKYMVIKDNSEHQKAIELITMNLWKDVYVAFCTKKEYWPEDCANEAVTQFRKTFFGE